MYATIFGTFFFMLCLSGCNTIVITHTQGHASDVVDSAATIEAKVDSSLDPIIDLYPKL